MHIGSMSFSGLHTLYIKFEVNLMFPVSSVVQFIVISIHAFQKKRNKLCIYSIYLHADDVKLSKNQYFSFELTSCLIQIR